MDVLVHGNERTLIRQMIKVHKKAMRIVLNEHITDSETLFQESNDVTSHHRNIPPFTIQLDTLFF